MGTYVHPTPPYVLTHTLHMHVSTMGYYIHAPSGDRHVHAQAHGDMYRLSSMYTGCKHCNHIQQHQSCLCTLRWTTQAHLVKWAILESSCSFVSCRKDIRVCLNVKACVITSLLQPLLICKKIEEQVPPNTFSHHATD